MADELAPVRGWIMARPDQEKNVFCRSATARRASFYSHSRTAKHSELGQRDLNPHDFYNHYSPSFHYCLVDGTKGLRIGPPFPSDVR